MEYEIIIRPKSICEFDSIEDLRRHVERLHEQINRKPEKRLYGEANLRTLAKEWRKLNEHGHE